MADLTVDTYYTVSKNRIRVEFNRQVKYSSRTEEDDAGNIKNYVLIAMSGIQMRVSDIEQVSVTEVDLLVNPVIGTTSDGYILVVTNVVSDDTDPDSAITVWQSEVFYGIDASVEPAETIRQVFQNDLAYNVSFGIETRNGDYLLVNRLEALKRRVYFQLATPVGGFAQFQGFGYKPSLKTAIIATALDVLEAVLTQRLLADPDIGDATVVVDNDQQFLDQGVAVIRITIHPTFTDSIVEFNTEISTKE